MQTNKNTLADEMFDSAKLINNVSRTGNLYGKLFDLVYSSPVDKFGKSGTTSGCRA